MERFPRLESLLSRFCLSMIVVIGATQSAWANSNAPPGESQLLPGYRMNELIAQQSGWPNSPPQWQSNTGNTSPLPTPPPQQTYQQQTTYPTQDQSQQGNMGAPAQQSPVQGYAQYGQQSQIQPGQLQGYPVTQQAPGQLGYAPPQQPQQGYAQQQQFAPQQQYQQGAPQGDPNQSGAPASPPGWTADYPTGSSTGSDMASQIPMDTAQPQKEGLGSKIGKALGGAAKMAAPVAGMGMAGLTAASMGAMMNPYGMNGMGMGMPYGMNGMGMPYGMGGMGMGGMGMPYGMGGMGMGGMGMPMGMGGMMPMGGMGMPANNMMMNSVLNQGLRMLQQR